MRIERLLVGCFVGLWLLPAWAGVEIQHWQLPSGARVLFVESHDLPMLDVNVDFPAGSSRDGAEKSGLASLTRQMLSLGAGGVSEDEIARRYADIGAVPAGVFDRDRAGLAVRTLSGLRERQQAIDTLALQLQRPDFSAAILEREKARVMAGIREGLTQPETLGERAFYRAVYRDHPYAWPLSGEVATVGALTRDDALAFHRRHYTAQQAVIALMGDITRAEAEAIAQQLVAGLPQGTALPPLPPVSPLPATVLQRIDHPAQQSHLFVGQPGMTRADADYFPLLVGNYIFGGGGFASRLMEQVRERRGLAYSVYSYFIPLAGQGPLQMGLQTQRAQAEEALGIVVQTLRDFVDRGPDAGELARAKGNLIQGFPLRIDSNRKIIEQLALIGFYGLPLDFLDQFPQRVERVTQADVLSAFSRRIRPEALVTVIVAGPGEGKSAAPAP